MRPARQPHTHETLPLSPMHAEEGGDHGRKDSEQSSLRRGYGGRGALGGNSEGGELGKKSWEVRGGNGGIMHRGTCQSLDFIVDTAVVGELVDALLTAHSRIHIKTHAIHGAEPATKRRAKVRHDGSDYLSAVVLHRDRNKRARRQAAVEFVSPHSHLSMMGFVAAKVADGPGGETCEDNVLGRMFALIPPDARAGILALCPSRDACESFQGGISSGNSHQDTHLPGA